MSVASPSGRTGSPRPTVPETVYPPVVTLVADEFRLTRTDAITALAKVAASKPDVFGWQPEVRPIRVRDRRTGQPTGETQEREVHHLWLRERMKARVNAIDPLARASAETAPASPPPVSRPVRAPPSPLRLPPSVRLVPSSTPPTEP